MSEAIRDRAIGAFIGLAVGDAIGTTLEFETRDTKPAVYDMVGGGPFDLLPGQWTDDTSMALCLADSLIAYDRLNEHDLMERFCRWYNAGENSSTGTCFDIGITTRNALEAFRRTGNPVAGPTDDRTGGNGSIMRLAPCAIRYWNELERLRDVSRRQSYTTHGATEAVDACEALATVLASLIEGKPLTDVLSASYGPFCPGVQRIMNGSYRGRARNEIGSSGYVIHTLEAALWAISETTTFSDAVLLAVNLGDDADTVGAVTGQIAGAAYGLTGIPQKWINRLVWNECLINKAEILINHSW
ncbi:ADP-ribosylglycohydrolase family protein [Methylobacterium sp. J-077]|uniref:ADP-ribosylglycohydrolase family protein n=1 Tax=Methylobacterium sp. J-077 TaxID=2836656 RepID=UPI001FBAA706|nr:ADP-ribosylglycohydrolase family protein [Methylobacterium sp. J-077]MCJ2122083.1 ADP-ribosylglycohydrolase family protein [Methylobacterium sp. J-077]